MAGRTLLQVDQTTSPDQGLLWHERERREDPDLERTRRLCARRHREEAAGPRRQPLQTPANSEHHTVRENAHFYGTF